MQVVEMRVRNENRVNWGKVCDAQTRTTKTLQHEQPAGKVGIDEDVFSADLQEEAGMSDESDAELTVCREPGLVSLT